MSNFIKIKNGPFGREIKRSSFCLLITWLLVILGGLWWPGQVNAATLFANSCTLEDVQGAVAGALDGDTVIIPAGSCTWNAELFFDTAITLMGAGINATNLTRGGGYSLLNLQVGHDKPVRITGLTIFGNGGYGIIVKADSGTRRNTSLRIDSNRFVDCSRSIYVEDWVYGVIDHNEFVNGTTTDITVIGDGNNSWDRGGVEGSPDALYIEDNLFTYFGSSGGGHLITSNKGARYVFRYNTLETSAHGIPYDVVDAHGACSIPPRGTYLEEVYENRFITIDGGYIGSMVRIRGGRGVIFNNELIGNQNGVETSRDIELTNYRSKPSAIEGSCSGSLKTVCQDNEGYPCLDQINGLYVWDNLDDGVLAPIYVENSGAVRSHVVENRDFFAESKPGYTPYVYPHPLVSGDPAPPPPPPDPLAPTPVPPTAM